MINSADFVSKKNYYLIVILNVLVYGFYYFLKILKVAPVTGGVKNRVLFIELAHLGDGLLLTPAIRLAKELRPELEIICLASPSAARAFMHNPYISCMEIIDVPWFNPGKKSIRQNIAGFQRLVQTIKRLQPETVVNFRSTGYHREHLAMFLAGIPQRIGFAHKGLDFLLTASIPFTSGLTVIQQKVEVISYWLTGQQAILKPDTLNPDFMVSCNLTQAISSILDNLSNNVLTIGINISAQHNYLWPLDHFVALCELLHEAYQPQIVFLGTADFASVVENIRSQLTFPTVSLVGATSLEELAVVLSRLDILVTVDTGMRHIANALGTPTVVLRHSADRATDFGRYVESEEVLMNDLPCSPCGKTICPYGEPECMSGIKPNEVLGAVKKLLFEQRWRKTRDIYFEAIRQQGDF